MYAIAIVLSFFFFAQVAAQAAAQDSTQQGKQPKVSSKRMEDFSLEELLDIEIVIASKVPQTAEQAPSIVSVISRQEIELFGARDIADVLRLIPGFEFGVDVQGLYGLGFRGIWAHEGKALIMIDGMSINCFGFGNGNYFGTVPVSMIERVEVIRGPGSATYGGFAEVAVVNIITSKGESLQGAQIKSSVGSIGGQPTYNANVSVGVTAGEDMKVAAHVGYQGTSLSARKFVDFSGGTLQMGADNSWKQWTHIIVTASLKGLEMSYNRNQTTFQAQDLFGTVLPPNNGLNTNRLYNYIETLRLQYNWNVGINLTLEPIIEFAQGNPISTAVVPITYIDSAGHRQYYNGADPWQNASAIGRRYHGELSLRYAIPAAGQLVVGAGYEENTLESLTASGERGLQTTANKGDTTAFMSRGAGFVFAQYSQQINDFGITLGTRYEATVFGSAFVPRVGITYVKNEFNAKLLYGWAFRVPLLWQAFSRQFFVGDPLKPELSKTAELEVGYKFTPNIRAKLNVFLIDIDKPITYIGASNSYQNFGYIQSIGAEGELQARFANYGAFLNFAYAAPGNTTSPDFMTGDRTNFLALPPVKVNVGGYVKLGAVSITPSATYLSTRYGQSQNSALNSTPTKVILETKAYNPLLLLNCNVSTAELIPNIVFNLSMYNILNAEYAAIQPYYGGHAPLPVNDRQITFGVALKLQ